MVRRSLLAPFCLTVCVAIAYAGQPQLTENKADDSMVPVLTLRSSKESFSVGQYWRDFGGELKGFLSAFIRRIMPTVMRKLYAMDISSDCLSGLLHCSSGIRKLRLWAFDMIDSSGKLPEGLLAGTLTVLGNYRQCVDIDVNETKVTMKGQYCMINVSPPIPEWRPFMSLHVIPPEMTNVSDSGTVIDHLTSIAHNLHLTSIKIGVCIPSLCSAGDLQKLIQIIPEQTGLNWKFDVGGCETKTETVFTGAQKVVLCALGVVALLVMVGSVADLLCKTEVFRGKVSKSTAAQVLRCFSLTATAEKLANYKAPDEATKFTSGIVVVAFGWTVCANTLIYANYDVVANFVEAIRILKQVFYEIFLGRGVPTQTFFFVSGFIAAYKVIKHEQNLSVWKYLLKRYCRYTPAYLFGIALVIMSPLAGSGPSWHSHMDVISRKCTDSWWANIFYVNNLMDPSTVCMDHTWMFAVDAQLHVLGLLVLLPLKRKPKIGLMLNFTLIAVSLITVALTNVYYDLPPGEITAFLNDRDRAYIAGHSYFRVYSHLCMYCTGIASGYIVAVKPKMEMSAVREEKTRKMFNYDNRLRLDRVKALWTYPDGLGSPGQLFGPFLKAGPENRYFYCWTRRKMAKTRMIGWFIIGVGALATLCSIHEWSLGVLSYPLSAALYSAFGKAAWAIFLAWLAIVCGSGNGGMVNSLLGWQPFVFLSRLTFAAYLFSPIIVQMIFANRKTHVYVEHFEILFTALSNIAPAFVIAACFFLLFEGPFISLMELLRKKHRSQYLEQKSSSSGVSSCNGVLTEKPMRFSQFKTEKDSQSKATDSQTKF